MIALCAAVQAESDPGFFYSVGHHPLVYTHHTPYVAPVVVASNNCKNEAGQLVPCAHGVAPGSSLYSFNNAPLGVVPVVAQAAQAEAAPAAEDAGVVDVAKREAEAEPEADPYLLYANYYGHPYGYYGHAYHGYYGYYGHPYYGYGGYGCRNNYGALVPCA